MILRGTATPAQATALSAVLTRTITALDAIAVAEDVMSKELRGALKVYPLDCQEAGDPFWNVGELMDGDPQGDLWSSIRKLREVLVKARAEAQAAATPVVAPVKKRRRKA